MNPTSPSPAPQPRDLFLEALEKSTPAERAAFLDGACRGDAALRSAVEELLANHHEDSFLEVPALSIPTGVTAPSEQPGQRCGNYKLLQQIGEGGFGVVWMAEQEQPMRRRVALKIIKVGMDTKEVIARFEQERQALAMMDHPNIAKVFDAGATQSGRPFFVMELVRGMKLTEYCDVQQVPTEQRLALFIQVCQAVQHAHQKGIIHRDLKPSNILVTVNEGEAVPKVIDFGVAKATLGRLTDATFFTQFQQMVGTPLYMSPEQAELTSLDIDTRSDIYSLGVLLYELLTGQTPIDSTTLAKAGMDEIRRIIREIDPPRPSVRVKTLAGNELTATAKRRHTEAAKLPAALRGDLDWIVMKCLEKDRRRRYDTANGLARDLQRHLANEAVTARPPTATYLISRLIRRNKLAVTAGAAIAASLVIGIAASVQQSVRADRQAERAKIAESQAVAALEELRSTAPAFAAQARSLAARERFAEAIEKLDYAIKLRPDVIDHHLTKADLLQCQLQFAGAATAYRAALSLKPDNSRAQANAALCDKLQSELDAGTKLSRESLMQLFQAMVAEHRPAAELLTVGRMVGEEKELILNYWVERLKDLPLPPNLPIEKRLTLLEGGSLALNLTNAPIADLTPLEGMPVARLNLAGCTAVEDLRPLSGLPLQSLNLERTKITDLAPLAKMRTLRELILSFTGVRDLSPLTGLLIEKLDLTSSKVADLAPLQGLPLQVLSLRNTVVSDLRPLAGLPLESLDCTAILAVDFSALTGSPLKSLILQSTRVGDLSFLRGMPLEMLTLNSCHLARGFHVLSELNSLKTVMLPDEVWNLPREELSALAALRQHSSLRQIATPSSHMKNLSYAGIGSAADFWRAWDRDMACVMALHRDGVKFSTYRQNDGGLSITIEDPAFKDLSVFRGSNLKSLTLNGTAVSDLAPLKGLPIEILHLRQSPVGDLSPLAGLALKEIVFREIPATDISFLSRAPLCDSLEKIWLEYLKVSDFSPVAACKALTTFSAFHSPLADLEPLRGLHLNALFLSGSKVQDLSGIASMPLEWFFFDLTPVTDITPLQKITTLKYVIVPEMVEKIEALRGLPHLQRLSFSFDHKVNGPSLTATEFWKFFDAKATWITRLRDAGIKIKALKQLQNGTWQLDLPVTGSESAAESWKAWERDMECVMALHRDGVKFSVDRDGGSLSITIEDTSFKDLGVFRGSNLRSLKLNGTSVSDLSPLVGLPLKNLDVRRGPVTDLSPLAGLALEELRVKETKVTDISVLSRAPLCNSLTRLWLEHLKVSDFSPVAACKALKIFSAFHCPMADLAPLQGLHLTTLFIAGTEVTDVSSLARMPLETIYFDSTGVTDVSPLQSISSLNNVILPGKVEKLETLRKLPNLRRLSFSYDPGVDGPSMNAAEFWNFFDATTAWLPRLRESGIKIKTLHALQDGTWQLDLEGSTIKDLAILSGARISSLRLGQTAVSDLTPLRGMPLLHLQLHQCPNIADLSPIKHITTLEKLSLPMQAKNFEFLRAFPKLELLSFSEDSKTLVPDRTAANFWKEYDAKKQ